MFLAAMHLLRIKDLKALNFSSPLQFYRHAGPKGPEESLLPRATVFGEFESILLKNVF